MRIYTKLVIDMATGREIYAESYDYHGPIAECKRGSEKATALQGFNTDQARAMNLSKLQQGMLSPETNFLQDMISNPTGFTPADLAAMRTQTMQNTQDQFASGLAQLKASLASRGLVGGATPTSGLAANNFGAYQAQGAQAMSQNLNNINIQNALQAQQNRWNAANALGQYAGLLNPNAFLGGATGSLGSLTQLTTAPSALGNIGTALAGDFRFGLPK